MIENHNSLCCQAERSLTKKYRKQIWAPFIAGVKTYELIQGQKLHFDDCEEVQAALATIG